MFVRLFACSVTATLLTVSTSVHAVTFTNHTYTNNLWSQNGGPNGHIRADLNGDGREDFISENDASFNSGCSGQFAVALSTGDGEYAAPVCYSLPSGVAMFFAAGSFHHNTTLDLVVTNDQGTLFEYQNDGTGHLQLVDNITLSGVPAGLVAGDFNHDGLIDVAYDLTDVNGDGGSSLHLLLGNINGTFDVGPVTSFKFAGGPAAALFLGDVDGDSRADIIVQGAGLASALILYGDAKGNFTPGPQVSSSQLTSYTPADFDSDGTTDLVGAPFSSSTTSPTHYNYLDLEWGHYNRTLSSQHVPLQHCVANLSPLVADFDGDGVSDILVAEDSDCKGSAPYTLNFMKGEGNGKFAAEQVVYSSSDSIFEGNVLRASHTSKPDVTLYQALVTNGNEVSNPEQVVLVNTTSGGFPICTPPNFQATGIAVCGPTSTLVPSSPVQFSFAATNDVPGRNMEVWVDGTKVAQSLKSTYTYHDFVQASVPLSNGQHRVDIYSVGWDYDALWDSFPVLVGQTTCPTPNVGLNVCTPIDYSQLTSPVTVYATSHGASGYGIQRMEIWVDGVKEYSTFGSQVLKTQLTIKPGWHKLDYYAAGTDGSLWEQTVWAEVR